MRVKERILAIRLAEKAGKYPNYAKALGVEASSAKQTQKNDFDPKASHHCEAFLLHEKGDSL